MLRAERHAGRCGGRLQALDEPAATGRQRVEEAGCRDQIQGGQPGGHRDRIARKRAGLVDGAQRRHLLHDRRGPADRAHRHATADDLAEGRQIRHDAGQLLHSARRDPQARHHLVEDQQRAVARAQRAQPLEKTGHRRNQVHVAGRRLDDQAGDVVGVLAEQCLDRGEVVELRDQRVTGKVGRHAGRAGCAEGERARARLHQQAVGGAVIAALELDDPGAAGVAARQPQRRHRRLGSGADEAHPLHMRVPAADALCQLGLHHVGGAERQTVGRRLPHPFQHQRMAVADDHRAPGTEIVDIALAGHVEHVGALRAADEARRAADRAERADGGVDAAHQYLAGAFEFRFVGGGSGISHGDRRRVIRR